MAELKELNASVRQEIGSRAARRLRDKGLIPAIIYGHGVGAMAVTLNEHDVEMAIQHGERLLALSIDGQLEHVLLKDVQYDTFGQDLLHVDLSRVNLDERVEVTVPVELRGTPVGTTEQDGVLQQVTNEINVECLVTDIPDEIRVSVIEMRLDDTMHLSDLELPSGAKLLDDPETVLCTVSEVFEEELEEAEEGVEAAEPEVIGEKPEEQEEGAEGEGEAEEG